MIQIFDATGKVEMSVGPRQYNSKENSHITEDFQSGLNKDQMYKVVVTAESFGESVQAEEMFSECAQLLFFSSHYHILVCRYFTHTTTKCARYK